MVISSLTFSDINGDAAVWRFKLKVEDHRGKPVFHKDIELRNKTSLLYVKSSENNELLMTLEFTKERKVGMESNYRPM